jgi:hypothetical protein
MIVTFARDLERFVSTGQNERKDMFYSLRDCLTSCPSFSRSAEFRLGLMARASSGGYLACVCTTSVPLGTIIVLLLWRPVSRCRSGRDFLGISFSASDDELAEDGGLSPPSALGFEVAPGIEEVVWLSSDSMTAK